MASDPSSVTQSAVNARAWSRSGRRLVQAYAGTELTAPEAAMLDHHREALRGRALELGTGPGRFTGHLAEIADEVHGMDIAPAMVERARALHPSVTFEVGDMLDLSRYADGSFDTVAAIANVIDVFGEEDRDTALREIRRVLRPGGLLILSTHNRGHAPHVGRPWTNLRGQPLKDLLRLPRRVFNHLRMRRFERETATYAVLNDVSHNFKMVHHYVSRDDAEAQLTANGFRLVECLDVDGREVAPGDRAEASPTLHYAALAA
ncbi:MAG: hypothetical protein QOH62_2617 [Solirubrobacteraceae bacterium]|jgi:SAM-dependent methyltransferase|nr:hypothetical protein [Solirubrobacteraceae bacterium]